MSGPDLDNPYRQNQQNYQYQRIPGQSQNQQYPVQAYGGSQPAYVQNQPAYGQPQPGYGQPQFEQQPNYGQQFQYGQQTRIVIPDYAVDMQLPQSSDGHRPGRRRRIATRLIIFAASLVFFIVVFVIIVINF